MGGEKDLQMARVLDKELVVKLVRESAGVLAS